MLGASESEPHETLKEEEKARIISPLMEGHLRRVNAIIGTTISVVCDATSAVIIELYVAVILFTLLFARSLPEELLFDDEPELLESERELFLVQ